MKKMNKLAIVTVFLVISMLICVACERGSYTIHGGKLKHEEDLYKGEYEKFDGYIEYSLGQLDKIHLKYSVVTKSGELNIYILDEEKNIVKSISGIPNGDDEVKEEFLKEQKLILKIDGNKHEGSYLIELLQ